MSDCPTLLPVSQAALVTGVGERRIRRWIAGGRLPTVESPLGKLVNPDTVRHLASDRIGQADSVSDVRMSDDPTLSDGVSELVALIERQQQTIMELSGRLGFYQAKLQEAEARILELSAPTAEPANEPAPTDQAPVKTVQDTIQPTSGQHSASERPMRPWWKRLLAWAGQPI